MDRPRTGELARGKWKGILLQLGLPAAALSGKNGPCPMCGGKDRFRFDNDKGGGSFICSGCGNGGSGFELLKRMFQWDFATAAKRVDEVLGNVAPDPVKRERPPADKLRDCAALWKMGDPITPGDLVDRYLSGRGVPLPENLDCLRLVHRCPVPHDGGFKQAMVASVKGPDGKGVTLHRTFLSASGVKAAMDNPRALMPGDVPDGVAVRLAACDDVLGVGTGIETSLAAGHRFGVPTWATLNDALLVKFIPPESVKRLLIFGDNDSKFGGQKAAYALAHRAACVFKIPEIEVHIPALTGTDWADAEPLRAAA